MVINCGANGYLIRAFFLLPLLQVETSEIAIQTFLFHAIPTLARPECTHPYIENQAKLPVHLALARAISRMAWARPSLLGMLWIAKLETTVSIV